MLNKKYVLVDKKLSEKDFSEKYWLDGDAEYQFHTMDIEDGTSERQQLLINNDRALRNMIDFYASNNRESHSEIHEELKRCKAISKIAITMALVTATLVIAYVMINNF